MSPRLDWHPPSSVLAQGVQLFQPMFTLPPSSLYSSPTNAARRCPRRPRLLFQLFRHFFVSRVLRKVFSIPGALNERPVLKTVNLVNLVKTVNLAACFFAAVRNSAGRFACNLACRIACNFSCRFASSLGIERKASIRWPRMTKCRA
jgi:hypothetical protein